MIFDLTLKPAHMSRHDTWCSQRHQNAENFYSNLTADHFHPCCLPHTGNLSPFEECLISFLYFNPFLPALVKWVDDGNNYIWLVWAKWAINWGHRISEKVVLKTSSIRFLLSRFDSCVSLQPGKLWWVVVRIRTIPDGVARFVPHKWSCMRVMRRRKQRLNAGGLRWVQCYRRPRTKISSCFGES